MKNPNGYVTVVCLDKTEKKRRKPYAARITVGFDESGKQITKYLGYYKSQKEANLALAQYHMVGLDVDNTKLTFEDVFEQWLKATGHRMTEKNQQSYRASFRLVQSLAKKRFKYLKSNHLQIALDGVDRKYNTKATQSRADSGFNCQNIPYQNSSIVVSSQVSLARPISPV